MTNDSDIEFDQSTGMPFLPDGRVWSVETLRVMDYSLLPWFPQGRVKVGIVWSGQPLFDWNHQAHAFKNEASIRRAAVRAYKKAQRHDARYTAEPTARQKRSQERRQIQVKRDSEKWAAYCRKEEARAAKLAERDAAWVGQYPPRNLGGL